MGHPTETAILQQALLAAIQTLQAVVGADEFSLRFLVNNTFVMVAYAAAFALRLLARWTEVWLLDLMYDSVAQGLPADYCTSGELHIFAHISGGGPLTDRWENTASSVRAFVALRSEATRDAAR